MALTIRTDQMGALAGAREEGFVERAAELLRRHWPERCAARGPHAVRETVRTAVRRAAGFGIRSERDVLRYLNVAFALGDDFAADPRYPWAAAILGDTALSPGTRIDRLVARAREEL